MSQIEYWTELTFYSRLLGNQNGLCSNSVDDKGQEILQFGIGNSFDSETSSTSWIAGNWLGREGKCVTIIDTPGVGDNRGADCTNAMETAAFVKSLKSIDAFVLVLKGTTTRIGLSLQNHINRFVEMFGQDFWQKVVIEVSFWSHSRKDAEQRNRTREMDEGTFTRDLNNLMGDVFKVPFNLTVVFVDPVFYPDLAEPEEKVAYQRETERLWSFIASGYPFICGDFCEAPDSLSGIPTLVDRRTMLKRTGSSVAISWTIFFGSCQDSAIQSYRLYKDGVEVFNMTDISGSSQKSPENLKGFPEYARIRDHCSTNEEDSCSEGQNEIKVITLLFDYITEDGFGQYSIKNGKGSSEIATLEQIVDGAQSEWSDFSPCSKTCLPEDGTWGSMTRRRNCTPPTNGGLPCDGEQEDVRQCAMQAGEATPK